MLIKIRIGDLQLEAELLDTPTARSILDALPFTANISTWGDEIYFPVPAHTSLEPDARSVVKVGELAYWPSMPAFCIFFGPTPASQGHEPRAASAVNVFGRLIDLPLELLRKAQEGDLVEVSR